MSDSVPIDSELAGSPSPSAVLLTMEALGRMNIHDVSDTDLDVLRDFWSLRFSGILVRD